jgi:ATP-dependent DNA ligase
MSSEQPGFRVKRRVEEAARLSGALSLLKHRYMNSEKMNEVRWVKPNVVAEIAFNNVTNGRHLRHARFVRLRLDKMSGGQVQSGLKGVTKPPFTVAEVAGNESL